VGVLGEVGPAYPSRTFRFTPGYLVEFVLLIFLVFCVVFFVCLFCPMSCVVNFANFSGLYILDCPFGFLSRLFTNDI